MIKRNLFLITNGFDQRRIRLVLVVMTLVLFVLGAGAPGDGGCC